MRLEYFVRRFFERLGAGLDIVLRRGASAGYGNSIDTVVLLPRIESAIESNLHRDGSHISAPNLIEIRYDYETWMRLGESRRHYLEKELTVGAFEYVYNRRYELSGEMQVSLTYDAFTRKFEVKADFSDPRKSKGGGASSNSDFVKAPSPTSSKTNTRVIILQSNVGYLNQEMTISSSDQPLGIGRNTANQIILKHPTVSNFHAALQLLSDGRLELADRTAANGTYVNGALLGTGGKSAVNDGDRLRFGDVELFLSIK